VNRAGPVFLCRRQDRSGKVDRWEF
jgi:hypothetical protein